METQLQVKKIKNIGQLLSLHGGEIVEVKLLRPEEPTEKRVYFGYFSKDNYIELMSRKNGIINCNMVLLSQITLDDGRICYDHTFGNLDYHANLLDKNWDIRDKLLGDLGL